MEALRQPVELYFAEPKAAPKGLAETIKLLDAIENRIKAIAAGPGLSAALNKTVTEIDAAFRKRNEGVGGRRHQFGDLAKSLGLSNEETTEVKRRLMSLSAAQRKAFEISGRRLDFGNISKASDAFRAAFEKINSAKERAFEKLLTAPLSAGGKGKVDGKIELLIPASQIQASVTGPITVNIPGPQFQASGGRDPATGQITGGTGGSGGGSGKGRGKSGGGLQPVPKGVPKNVTDEIERTITQTAKGATEAFTTLLDGGKSLTKTFNETGDEIKRVTKDPKLRNIGKQLTTDLANLKRQAQADILNVKTGDKAKDLLEVAKIKDALADNIRKSFKAQEQNLPAPARATLEKVYTTQANVVAGQAREAERLAQAELATRAQKQATDAKKLADKQAADQKAALEQANAQQAQAAKADSRAVIAQAKTDRERIKRLKLDEHAERQRLAAADEANARELRRIATDNASVLTRQQRAGMRRQAYELEQRAAVARATPPLLPPAPPPAAPGLTQRLGLNDRLNPLDFLKNTIKVGAWGAAVSAAAAPVAVLTYSLQRMIEVGSQTARLEQVFSKVGGSARELTDDVLSLAAANGRSSDEALESAVAWSRLGLTRVQVNEAVRVSLLAANVAEMSASDATKHLSALMAAYSLNVGELNSVLGMLNNTSNKYNVTNSDLLTGLSRTAAVAKQAGIPLAELQGMIGAAVGRTGQTGANIGNAIKSVIVSMSTPDVQDFLQERFKLGSMGEEIGQMKSMSQVMRELYVTYMGLNDEERKSLTVRVAGKTQASRFVAILESYNQAQKLAADSQLHLNSAEQENARILATQKAQLIGLRTEWDRMVTRATIGGSAIPAAAVGGGAGMLAGRLLTGATFGGRFGPIGAGVGAAAGLLSGGSANEQLTDLEHLVRNVLRLVNSGPQLQNRSQTLHERLASASLRGMDRSEDEVLKNFYRRPYLTRAKMLVGEVFHHPIRTLNADLDRLNGDSSDAFQEQVRQLLQKQIGSESASAGYGTEAERLRTLANVLGQAGTRPEELKGLFEKEDAGVRQLVAENKLVEAQTELRRLATAQEVEAATAKATGLKYQEQVVKLLGDEIALNEKKIKDAGTGKDTADDLRSRNVNLNSLLLDAKKVERQMLTDQEEMASGDYGGRRQKTKDRFAAVARQMEGLQALGALQRPALAADRLEEENDLLLRQIEILKALELEMERMGRPVDAAKVADQRRDLTANLPNDADRELARTLDRRSLFTRRAEQESDNAGIGTSQAERLLAREKYLQEELTRLKQRQADWSLTAAQHEADNTRALVLQNQLLATRENIQKRIRDIAAEEKQARLEGAREFNRSLLMSGPGDLLKKFAANQLNSRGTMSAGQFFSLSPELRGDVDLMNGGEAVRRLREESNRLRNTKPLTAEEEAAQRANGSGFGFRSDLGPNFTPPVAPGALDTAKVTAELGNVAVAMGSVAGSANNLGQAMIEAQQQTTRLAQHLAVLLDGAPFGTPPGLNIGFSLGSQ